MDKKAGKLARIGALLLRQGEAVDAARYASQSIFLEPSLPAYKLLASALAKQRRNTAALHAFEAARAISGGDTDVALSVGHAAVLVALGRPAAAAEILSKAAPLAGGGPAAAALERLRRRLMPSFRFAALQSEPRALAWRQALRAAVSADGVSVLDISPTPLTALLAAEAGAAVLRVAALGPLEARVLLKSACIGCIELLDGIEAAAALKPRTVDAKVIVADCDAASPLASNWLPSLRHARASLLAPGAAVVPRALTVYASLVESEALASLGCVWRDATHGLDLRPLNALAHGSRAVRLSELPHSLLTDAAVALRLELDGAEPPAEAGEATTELVVRRAGVAHAVVLWHALDLGGDASVSTAPGEAGDARQVVLFLRAAGASAESDLGVELRDGQHVHLRLRWQPPREPEVELYDDATTPTTPLGASLPEAPRLGEQNAAGASRPLFEYHFAMLNDTERTAAFAAALEHAVREARPALAVDIGAGSGLLAMLAARAGAPRVLALEMTAEIAALATRLVAAHGLDDRVRVLPMHSSALDLDSDAAGGDAWAARAELVFEVLGTDPLCEGLLPSLRHARASLLAPGAAVVPRALTVYASLVESEALASLGCVWRDATHGLDLRPLNVWRTARARCVCRSCRTHCSRKRRWR